MTQPCRVFDENVLIVANGASEHADADCQLAAIATVLAARDDGSVLFSYDFLEKYNKHCSHAGAPGVGDAFFVWLRDNAGTLPQVTLEWEDESPIGFPPDKALADFDFDDRLWVAAVIVHDEPACIVNCVDSDYSHCKKELDVHGVEVVELCPQHLKPKPTATD
jgi:hypothetical protein